ncbi:hypothetical protein AGR4B_Lc60211 [Agrobacterium tumefaciens str. CFBP 5621]|nr:hypothetical protein AGR4B_Lc60211 [Agrobacterium tumefaciens str. CFBP 5621]
MKTACRRSSTFCARLSRSTEKRRPYPDNLKSRLKSLLFCFGRYTHMYGREKQTTKSPENRAFLYNPSASGSEAEAAETLVELGNATTAVHKLLVAARPCRMGLGVDFKVHDCAFRTPGRAGFVFGAIGHDDLDRVISGMDISLHDNLPG